jgi:hypothetical protein
MSTCKNGTVELSDDGRWRKCIGGRWVPLPGVPVLGGKAGAMIAIDKQEDFTESDEIRRAIHDPKKQVVVHVIDVDES